MSTLRIINARIVTPEPSGDTPRRGSAMGALRTAENATILCKDGRIACVGSAPPAAGDETVLDAEGCAVLPGLIDCHTHLCWAGSRVDEWEEQLRGVAYLDILARGGGIMSTVRAVRAASRRELADALLGRALRALRNGSTTIEVKSGYGLTTADELKMLGAIRDASSNFPGTLVPTALLGHAKDPDQPSFCETTLRETLPAVSKEFPGITIDAYCERGAWSVEECGRLFDAARAAGHPCRVHADQFTPLGMTRHAAGAGLVSVDHLEASHEEDLRSLAASGSIGVILPAVGFHAQNAYAHARTLIDAGGALALATNANPGSAPCFSLPVAMAIGVRRCGLTPAEAIVAATRNAAHVLGLRDRGVVAAGARADLIILGTADERSLLYEFPSSPRAVVAGGRVV